MSQSISSTEKITEKVASQPDSAEVHSVSVGDYIAETRPWYKVKHLRFLSFCIFVITISSTNNGYDGSMLNGLQSLSHWQKTMGHPTGKRLGHLSNGTLFGAVAALPFVPYFSDRFGRRKLSTLVKSSPLWEVSYKVYPMGMDFSWSRESFLV